MSTGNILLHCGGKVATFEEVAAVPLPEKTRSYTPVAHADLDRVLRDNILHEFGQDTEIESKYGLNRKGLQLFGTHAVKGVESDTDGLVIGWRNSYDKSMSVGVAGGARVFVCDNLALSGDQFTVLRKHTTHVWKDVIALCKQSIRGAGLSYRIIHAELEVTKTIPVQQDAGFEFLGRAYGHQVITAQQASVAFDEWREPSHEEFSDRNLYGLYNAVTEGLKRGNVGNAVTRHTGWHDHVRRAYPQIVTDVEVIAH